MTRRAVREALIGSGIPYLTMNSDTVAVNLSNELQSRALPELADFIKQVVNAVHERAPAFEAQEYLADGLVRGLSHVLATEIPRALAEHHTEVHDLAR